MKNKTKNEDELLNDALKKCEKNEWKRNAYYFRVEQKKRRRSETLK